MSRHLPSGHDPEFEFGVGFGFVVERPTIPRTYHQSRSLRGDLLVRGLVLGLRIGQQDVADFALDLLGDVRIGLEEFPGVFLALPDPVALFFLISPFLPFSIDIKFKQSYSEA